MIFASGSEVEIALEAKAKLDAAGFPTRVVSVPSMDLFEKQGKAYKEKLLGTEKIRVADRGWRAQGWDRFIGNRWHVHRHEGLWCVGPGRKALSSISASLPQPS